MICQYTQRQSNHASVQRPASQIESWGANVRGQRIKRQAVQADRWRQGLQGHHHQQRNHRAACDALQESQGQQQVQVVQEGQDHSDGRAGAQHPETETTDRKRDREPRGERHGDQFAGAVGGGQPRRIVQAEAERSADIRERQRTDAAVQPRHQGGQQNAGEASQSALRSAAHGRAFESQPPPSDL
jgi:hypothetical protein